MGRSRLRPRDRRLANDRAEPIRPTPHGRDRSDRRRRTDSSTGCDRELAWSTRRRRVAIGSRPDGIGAARSDDRNMVAVHGGQRERRFVRDAQRARQPDHHRRPVSRDDDDWPADRFPARLSHRPGQRHEHPPRRAGTRSAHSSCRSASPAMARSSASPPTRKANRNDSPRVSTLPPERSQRSPHRRAAPSSNRRR